MALRYNFLPKTGNINTIVAGSTVAGNTLILGDQPRTLGKTLSALVSFTAATATLTATVKWQVSNDGTTFVDLANGPQNAASVIFATGTAAIVTKAIPAPSEIWGWRMARIAIVTGVATGAAGDLYSLGYCYRYSRTPDE